MSLRIRGQEITARFKVDDDQLDGSWFKLEQFSISPKQDIREDEFVGETETDTDFQHHGFGFSGTLQELDTQAQDLLQKIVDLDRAHLAHPEITMTIIRTYRQPGQKSLVSVYHDITIAFEEETIGNRKEYVKTKFKGHAKRKTNSQGE